jgi:glycoprotein endo-alpha-1,2-mannosidase
MQQLPLPWHIPGAASELLLFVSHARYGAPATDGQYQHWNHEVLPHWDANKKGSYEFGSQFEPPRNVHSPFYPQKGPYSSSDLATIRAHIQEMVQANITGMVRQRPCKCSSSKDNAMVRLRVVRESSCRQLQCSAAGA